MESSWFRFERLCFALRKNEEAYTYVRSKTRPPLLHFYEVFEKKLLGPFVAEQVDCSSDPERKWPIVYEVTDPNFDKDRPRRSVLWALTPSDKKDFYNEGFGREFLYERIIHRKTNSSMQLLALPDDSSLCYFDYATLLYPGIDRELPAESYFGAGGYGMWGVSLCSRIVFL